MEKLFTFFRIASLILLLLSPIILPLIMKNVNFYKGKNLVGIFFICLPIIFIIAWVSLPYATYSDNREDFLSLLEIIKHPYVSTLYVSTTLAIAWMFSLWYIQWKVYKHSLSTLIGSMVLFCFAILFFFNLSSETDSISSNVFGSIVYWSGASVSFFILTIAVIAYITHVIIYLKRNKPWVKEIKWEQKLKSTITE